MIKVPAAVIGEKQAGAHPLLRLVMPQIRVSSLVAPLAAKPQGGPNQPYSHGHHGCRFRDCDQGKARRDRRAILSKRQARESTIDSLPNRKLNCLGLYDSEME